MTPSIRFGLMPRALSATNDDAPQSISRVDLTVSRKKQVLNLPPEPKASPEPTTVSRTSRLRARARRNLGVPALEMLELVGNRQLGGLHEIHRNQAGDVGHRVMVAGDEPPALQLAIQKSDEFRNARLVGIRPCRHLRHLHLLHGWMRVAKDVRHRRQKMLLDPTLPHLDARDLERAAAEQRRLGLQLLEIAADRDRLGDHRAIVE